MQHVIHREKDRVQRLFAMLFLDEVIHVRDTDFGGEAGIDCAATGSRAVEFGTGVVRINNIFWLHAQAFEISTKQRRVSINVKNAWNANAHLLAAFHERAALFGALAPPRPTSRWKRIGHA